MSVDDESFTGLIPGSSVSVWPMAHAGAMSTGIQSAKQAALQVTNKVINKVFLKAVSKSGRKKHLASKHLRLKT